MKVLVAVDWYYPAAKSGGPAVSISNLCALLSDFDFFVVTSNHDFGTTECLHGIDEGWNQRQNEQVLYLPDENICLSELKKVVDSLAPDCIMLNSLFGYRFTVPLLKIALKRRIPVLLAPRGELCGGFSKKYKKIPYIFSLRYWLRNHLVFYLCTSNEEKVGIGRYIGKINEENFLMLDNIPTVPPTISKSSSKESGTLRCVFLSRIQPKKNLLTAIGMLSGIKGKVIYDIYGPVEDEEYWRKCLAAIEKLPDNVMVNYCGLLNKDDVHAVLSAYDVMLFPTLSENYGHVIVEALLSKCPVIISDQTPWDHLEEYNAGFSISLNSPEKFIEVLQCFVDCTAQDYQKFIDGCGEYTDYKLNLDTLKTKYTKAICDLVKKGVSQ